MGKRQPKRAKPQHQGTPEFQVRLAAIESLRQNIRDLEEQIDSEIEDIATDVCRIAGLDVGEPVLGGHHCPEESNPVAQCIYDVDEDPCMDSCLFCHEPRERK